MEKLKTLFTSGARVSVLKLFLDDYVGDRKGVFFIREIDRLLDGFYVHQIRHSLNDLEEVGILQSEERERKKFYSLVENKDRIHALITLFNSYVE